MSKTNPPLKLSRNLQKKKRKNITTYYSCYYLYAQFRIISYVNIGEHNPVNQSRHETMSI